jgi:hypothetical protein
MYLFHLPYTRQRKSWKMRKKIRKKEERSWKNGKQKGKINESGRNNGKPGV